MSRGKLYQEVVKLKPKMILEIGACDFQDSKIFKNNFKEARVVAVEADIINYQKHHKAANDTGVETYFCAISDKDEEVTFYPSLYETKKNMEWRFAGSILKPLLKEGTEEGLNHSVLFDKQGVKVQGKRFDTFCKDLKIETIDLLFLDVEGAEYRVVQSMGQYRPKLIFAETAHYDLKSYDNEINLQEFHDLMESLGYEIIDRLEFDTLYKLK